MKTIRTNLTELKVDPVAMCLSALTQGLIANIGRDDSTINIRLGRPYCENGIVEKGFAVIALEQLRGKYITPANCDDYLRVFYGGVSTLAIDEGNDYHAFANAMKGLVNLSSLPLTKYFLVPTDKKFTLGMKKALKARGVNEVSDIVCRGLEMNLLDDKLCRQHITDRLGEQKFDHIRKGVIKAIEDYTTIMWKAHKKRTAPPPPQKEVEANPFAETPVYNIPKPNPLYPAYNIE